MSDWFEGGGAGGELDVVAMMDSEAGDAVWQLVQLGAAVMVGLSADGGALAVTLMLDGRKRREWFRSVDDLRSWLAEALPAVRDAVDRQPASSGKRGRSRSRS